jgi:hypothetical protein
MTREEAIKILSERYSSALFSERTALETLIPELAESEDERIRKFILEVIKTYDGMSNSTKEKCISYLEKQKLNTEGDFGGGYDCGYQAGYADAVNEMKPKVATATLDSEKQKEQKPAEFDEYKIIKKHITEDSLSSEVNKRLTECGWYVTDEKPEEWSEEDEKVFADIISDIEYYRDLEDAQFHDSYNKKIRLLKSLYRSNFQSNREWNEEDEKMLKWIEDILLIADGDLNDKLNGKASPITDSAYSSIKRCIVKSRSWLESLPERFNLEPKDQKPLEYLPKEKVYHIMHELSKLSLSDIIPIESEEYEKIDEITSNVRDLLDYPIEQKPEWSEEDERMLSRCIKSVKCSKQFADSETYKAAKDVEMNWLKSLKLKPKQEWSEEDKHRCEDAIYFLETAKKHYASTSEIELTIEWLKSLQPQSKQYKQCIYGDTPSVERCAVCSAWCDRRVREEDKQKEGSVKETNASRVENVQYKPGYFLDGSNEDIES